MLFGRHIVPSNMMAELQETILLFFSAFHSARLNLARLYVNLLLQSKSFVGANAPSFGAQRMKDYGEPYLIDSHMRWFEGWKFC